MAISYPLTLPSSPMHSSVKWTELNAQGVSQSPFTFEPEVFDYSGSAWAVEIGYPPMDREEFAPFSAILSALRGSVGTFYFGSYLQRLPLGAAGGTPLVNGASQVGYTLATDGWPNSTLVLKAGDFFQVGNNLYKNLTDATTNGSGEVTLDIWPRAKSHANNASIITSSPVGIFRLAESRVSTIEGASKLFQLQIAAIEAI